MDDEVTEERVAEKTVRALAAVIRQVAQDGHIWQWGDGEGGAVHQMVCDELGWKGPLGRGTQ